jgi:signal transduction histidine kinase
MKRLWSSFGVRLLVASFAWTLGLLYVTHLTSVVLMVGPHVLTPLTRILLTLALAVVLMACGALIVRRAFSTFGSLRRRLVDVHEGRARAVTGEYMSEVQPIVTALNDLLDHQDRRVREALSKAGDLAHGLKTPLAVINQEAERAAAGGHAELAATLAQQVERMRRQIDYHLVHARAAASGPTPGARCSVAESAAGIARTLERLHAQRGLSIRLDVPAHHAVRGQREDLDEMLGNLLDNACKWARTRVEIAARNGNGRIVITVDDDGPGIPGGMRQSVMQRGVRADEASPGSGLGLAIVRDLAELYGGCIALEESTLGGLRARLELPPAQGSGIRGLGIEGPKDRGIRHVG